VINGVGAALAGSGLALDITDWGRAHRAQNQQRSIIVPETTRMEKEREVNLS
jgi:hypothetical protein